MMSERDRGKVSVDLPKEMLRELERLAKRLDRSRSWVVQQAWRLSRERIRTLPSPRDMSLPRR